MTFSLNLQGRWGGGGYKKRRRCRRRRRRRTFFFIHYLLFQHNSRDSARPSASLRSE